MFFTTFTSIPRCILVKLSSTSYNVAEGIKPPSDFALLESGQYSYFVIECERVEFNVHRTIICCQSTMLERAANGYFKVSFRLECPLSL
jgi:hypothetical protein